ncbi:MAG: DUF4442 domain-containing protein [Longimicrobiales bacterium]|nr:DUF4442 domain-containing protein [Longimicrobiales bacterium]
MPPDPAAPGARVLSLWRRLAPLPGGAFLFARALGRMVPYTGALGARVRRLEPGHACVTLAERRGVRNHLRSIHAVALANLGELATGLAVLTALPVGVRGIVTELCTTYHAKARGTIRAECRAPGPFRPDTAVEVTAELTDGDGVPVATVRAQWTLGEAS